MFKKSLLTIALTAMAGMLFAQSLRFEYKDEVYDNNAVVICTRLSEWLGELEMHMQVRNMTNETLDVIIEKEEIQMVAGTTNSICWGMCYSPTVSVSPESHPVEANALNDSLQYGLSFHHNIDPDGTWDPGSYLAGTSIVKYYAYPSTNPEDKVCIVVWFAYNAQDVKEETFRIGQAYPNPASSTVNFDFRSKGIVEATVYNLLGQEVKSQLASGSESRVSIAVDDLQPGIYFCSFRVNNETVKTEKFIVKR